VPIPVRPERGRIIWAEILDQQGRNPKLRPAVILTSRDEIVAGEPIVVAVASTQLHLAKSEDKVELPWTHQGHPRTHLKKRCAVVCSWTVEIKASDIQECSGMVPEDKITAILTRVAELMGECELEGK
jgi:mRNA-degrading endonuclease toxin of MazEF toxin-antitoxin module